jgi:hypothetical protein
LNVVRLASNARGRSGSCDKRAFSTAVNHVEKILRERSPRGVRTLDFDPNRANRSKVIR